MKLKTILGAVVLTFACCFVSQASVTNALWWSANSQNLVCSDGFSGGTLTMNGTQMGMDAAMAGTIQTDTTLDPTLTLGSSVNNDTGLAWIGYQVNVIMGVPFSFVPPGPTVNNPPPNDWIVASVVAPTLQASGPYAGQYEGTLLFSDGTPVGVGGELDWQYSINFGSSLDYSFTQEMIPVTAPIPEPSALGLIGLGGLVLVGRMVRQSRKVA
jgi:hypothetical protein